MTPTPTNQQDTLLHVLRSIGLLLGAITSLLSLIIISFVGYHVIFFIFSLLTLVYFVYMVIDEGVFQQLKFVFYTRNKFKTVHQYFDGANTHTHEQHRTTQRPVSAYFDSQSKGQKKIVKKPQSLRVSLLQQSKAKSTFKRSFDQSSSINNQTFVSLSMQSQQKKYVEYRQQHQKCLKQFKKKYSIGDQQYRDLLNGIKDSFNRKIGQLLSIYERSIKQMVEIIQKNYEVKVRVDQQKKYQPNVLVVGIEQSLMRVGMLNRTGCLPWQSLSSVDNGEHLRQLKHIAQTIKEVDGYICPGYKATHDGRNRVIQILKKHIAHASAPSYQLVQTVMKIYNNSLASQQNGQQFMLRLYGNGDKKPHIQLRQTNIGSKMHIDMSLIRPQKQTILRCMPGDYNIWSVLVYAVLVYRLKL